MDSVPVQSGSSRVRLWASRRAAAFGGNAAVLLLIAAFLARAWWTGRAAACVAPRYVWLTPFGAVLVGIMGIASLLGGPVASCCASASEHGPGGPGTGVIDRMRRAVGRTIIAAPFVLGILVDPMRLSAEGIRKRQVPAGGEAASRTVGRADLDRAFAYVLTGVVPEGFGGGPRVPGEAGKEGMPDLSRATVRDVLEWVREGRGRELDGCFVSLTGQADRPGNPGSATFDLVRVVVVCCIADAVTVGLEVRAPPGTAAPREGEWLRVSGVLRAPPDGADGVPALEATAVEPVPEPKYPYL